VCNHTGQYYCRRYVDKDGTPMIHFRCYDCGYEDHGHVYTNEWPKNWIVDTCYPENNAGFENF
jgi:hypothetical protein